MLAPLPRSALASLLLVALGLTLPSADEPPVADATPAPATRKPAVDLDPSFLIPQKVAAGDEHDHSALSHTPDVVFTADGTRMLTTTSENELIVFDASTRKLLHRVPAPGKTGDAVSITPDGKYVVWVLEDESVVVVDVASGKELSRDAKPAKSAERPAAGPREPASIDEAPADVASLPVQTVSPEADNAAVPATRETHAAWVRTSPDGRFVAVSRGAALEIRSLPELRLEATFAGHDASVTNIAWSRDGARIGSTAANGRLLIHDAKDPSKIVLRLDKEEPLHALTFHPTRRLVAFGGVDKRIYLYDLEEKVERDIAAKTAQPFWITCLGFSPDGQKLAVGDESCDIWLYDLASGEQVFHNKHHVECWLGSVAWTPDSQGFLFACRPNAHAGKPQVCGWLAQAEASRDPALRESRAALLVSVRAALAAATDDEMRATLTRYQTFLEHEEQVVAPDSSVLAQQFGGQTFDASGIATANGELFAPAGWPSDETTIAASFPIDELPAATRDRAAKHRRLHAERTAFYGRSNFCVNQWRIAK